MSGSLVLRRGVGTQMLMVSRSRTAPKSVVARSLPACTSVGQYRAGDIAHIGFARIDARGLARVEVDAGDGEAGLGELHGQRQSHISEPDDAHARAVRRDLFFQYSGSSFRGGRGHISIIQRALPNSLPDTRPSSGGWVNISGKTGGRSCVYVCFAAADLSDRFVVRRRSGTGQSGDAGWPGYGRS